MQPAAIKIAKGLLTLNIKTLITIRLASTNIGVKLFQRVTCASAFRKAKSLQAKDSKQIRQISS